MPLDSEWTLAKLERFAHMSDWACNLGCFVCGPEGQRLNHNGTGCCRSTMCNHDRWGLQIKTWLSTELKFNTTLWLEVEKATQEAWCEAEAEFKATLKPKAPKVKWVERDPNNPSKARIKAKARKQAQR